MLEQPLESTESTARMASGPRHGLAAWPQEHEQILREKLAEGWSAGKIKADALPMYSRSAIIGKKSRLGLTKPLTPTVRAARRRNAGASLATIKSIMKSRRPDAPIKSGGILRGDHYVPRAGKCEPLAIDYFAFNNGQCCYPLEDRGEYGIRKVCGLRRWGERPYCLAHCQLTYVPVRGR